MTEIDTDSIAGLWMNSGGAGYLTGWFGRLWQPYGQFVPLTAGLNVIYGRNGAGKTQLLEAIAAAANFRLSAYEGLIFKNPQVIERKWTSNGFESSRSPLWPTAQDAWQRLCASETVDCWVGDSWAFDASEVTPEQSELALQIIEEFRESGYVMLTRAPSQGEPGRWGRSATDMRPPMSVQYVPVLPPWVEAPVTRRFASEIRQSYHQLFLDLEPTLESIFDEEGELDEGLQEQARDRWDAAADQWLAGWAWNPLLNQRNFDYHAWRLWVEDFNVDRDRSLNADGRSMLFLPALIQDDLFKSADEFVAMKVPPVLTLQRETSVSDSHVDTVEAAQVGRGIRDGDQFSAAAAHYAGLVGHMLEFLPNAFHMSIRQQEERDSFYRSKPALRGTLLLSTGSPASLGSAAERRWIQLARQAYESGERQWILIDEPEAGLHRSAEAVLAECLRSPAWASKGVLVVASHSPELLDAGDNVIHVSEGLALPFKHDSKRDLEALGLRPADLLGAVRSILLVEGEHERVIFNEVIGDELRRLRCHIVVARGAKNMRDVFDSQILFDYTDARLVCLMDNMNATEIAAVWTEAKTIAVVDPDAAGVHIRKALPRSLSGENRFMGEFMTRALEAGAGNRVGVHGMSKADIVLYLDPHHFGLQGSWDDLLSEYDGETSLKVWATKRYGADFGLERIRAASQSLDHLPADFGSMLMTIADRP